MARAHSPRHAACANQARHGIDRNRDQAQRGEQAQREHADMRKMIRPMQRAACRRIPAAHLANAGTTTPATPASTRTASENEIQHLRAFCMRYDEPIYLRRPQTQASPGGSASFVDIERVAIFEASVAHRRVLTAPSTCCGPSAIAATWPARNCRVTPMALPSTPSIRNTRKNSPLPARCPCRACHASA